MEKSRDAFRTISEVAEWLDVPTHVLRFWESRFSQIKPVKRAGGRRYYRPSDMRVIGGVKTLLHDQGMTIRGVQKLFREKGIKHVSSHAPQLYNEDDNASVADAKVIEHEATQVAPPAPMARTTYDAEPDPIVDDVADEDVAEPANDAKEEPVLEFSRARSAVQPSETPKPVPIQVPDGVALADPDDDDANHTADAGVAARLRVMPRGQLAQHSNILAAAVEKLKALHARAD